ncbi:MAG: DoxX family membrane protein [Candidatus Zixiibacteriota bacterium]|nr:MAG: DoxX family membrane protein [candidate division Zixibacteria bacterium]
MVKTFLEKKQILLISRIVLGGLFIYSSIDKIIDPLAFATIIHHYRLAPPNMINFAAVVIPWIELIAGVFLIFGIRLKASALTINLMLVFFTVVLAITAFRGINVACGCFSTSTAVKSNLVIRIIEDFGMLALGLHVMFFSKK